MNFSISGGDIGLIGAWVIFGALMMVFTVVVTLIIRAVRGRDADDDLPRDGRAPEDDYIL